LILLDANLLLYAYDSDGPQHERARAWLEQTLNGSGPVGISWLTLWAFLRIGTNPRVYREPLTIGEAEAIVAEWLALPSVALLEPGDRYWEIFGSLLLEGQVAGPLVMDAALAALALEHGAVMCTTDRDFDRFRGLKKHNPLE
jgi:toxin-antitoxin system PIN domain toxin